MWASGALKGNFWCSVTWLLVCCKASSLHEKYDLCALNTCLSTVYVYLVCPNIFITADKDILRELSVSNTPKQYIEHLRQTKYLNKPHSLNEQLFWPFVW